MSKSKRRAKSEKSKDGWILYLMVHFPAVIFWKIGITGRSATARAADIDAAVWGFPIPVCIVVVPGAYGIEQWLHGIYKPLRADFYKGDGHREWFWFPVIVPTIALMLTIWGFYLWVVSELLGLKLFDWYLSALVFLVSLAAKILSNL